MEVIQNMIKERRAKAVEREILQKMMMILDVFGGEVPPSGGHPNEHKSKEYKDDYFLIRRHSLKKTGELCDCHIEFCGRLVFQQYVDEVTSYAEGAWDKLLDLVFARADLTQRLKKISEDEDQLRRDFAIMKDELGKWGI